MNRPTALVFALLAASLPLTVAEESAERKELDATVQKFLRAHADDWHDMNVPEVDGKLLHDLILEHGFKQALDIGTSTGHSAIWMAWALSKTGGRLITIEIDESRHRQAVRNFEEAGLERSIDARHADAHELVPTLDGPFDFVFCDADKDWYTNYFRAVSAKLKVGGCFTAHNVTMRRAGIREFLEHVRGLPNYETRIDRASSSGVSISCKTSDD